MCLVVAIDAHQASCANAALHWDQTLADPKRILSAREALIKLAREYPDPVFVTQALRARMRSCEVGDEGRIFGRGLSDHLPIVLDLDIG